ncbi:MAG TPA: threonine synthase [Acidobacteriota bacterium]|nr:threonine synthase [Acidobacteriota bacterium]
MSYVSCLQCSRCQEEFSHRELHNLCRRCSSPLLVRYRLDEAAHDVSKTSLLDRPPDMWRYLEVLPVDHDEDIVSLGEGMTPLLPLRRLGAELGLNKLFMKDEGVNPTGSFKARGLSAAVTMARKLGAGKLCIPTAGNAGGALAAYAARAGIPAFIFMPADTPSANVVEARMTGAHVEHVEGVITDAGAVIARRKDEEGWFDVSTLKEPYRIEGKKTMGYELAEQFNWKLPDVIFYPTGGGTGLIGMWKAFEEMERMGWIDSRRPRMVSVQAEGCAPIVKAFHEGAEEAPAWPNPHTISSGLRVPKAIGDFLMLRALRESNGNAVAVSDEDTYRAVREVGRLEGVFLCPEGAACFVALQRLVEQEWMGTDETVVVFNTGSGTKYVDTFMQFEKEHRPAG